MPKNINNRFLVFFFRQRSGNDFLFFSLIFDRETWVCGLFFFFLDNLVLAFFLNGCDRCQGLFYLINLVIVDQLVFFTAAQISQTIPDRGVGHEIHKRSGSVVTQLPK